MNKIAYTIIAALLLSISWYIYHDSAVRTELINDIESRYTQMSNASDSLIVYNRMIDVIDGTRCHITTRHTGLSVFDNARLNYMRAANLD